MPLVERVLERRGVGDARFHATERGRLRAALAFERLLEALHLPERDAARLSSSPSSTSSSRTCADWKAARGDELIAELQIIARGERLDHLEVGHGLFEERADALERAHRGGELDVGHRLLAEEVARGSPPHAERA
ncbi:MAG: hypothetical protein U0441_05835 [Polyangiaceae bacterium]